MNLNKYFEKITISDLVLKYAELDFGVIKTIEELEKV